jgi:hypothetical protein
MRHLLVLRAYYLSTHSEEVQAAASNALELIRGEQSLQLPTLMSAGAGYAKRAYLRRMACELSSRPMVLDPC